MKSSSTDSHDDDGIMALLKPTTSNGRQKKSRKKVTFSNIVQQSDKDVAVSKQEPPMKSSNNDITATVDPQSFSRTSTLKPSYELSKINDILIGDNGMSDEKNKGHQLPLEDSNNIIKGPIKSNM